MDDRQPPPIQPGHIVRAFIAGPSDVSAEKLEAIKTIWQWNSINSFERAIAVQPVSGDDARAEHGSHPQKIINSQLLDGCAILIAIFRSRLGSPTDTEASGTVEEIKEFIRRRGGKHVMLFFSNENHPNKVSADDLNALRAFKTEMSSQGLYVEFDGDFHQKISQHLQATMIELDREIGDVHSEPRPTSQPELIAQLGVWPPQSDLRNKRAALLVRLRLIADAMLQKLGVYENANREDQANKFIVDVAESILTELQVRPDSVGQHFALQITELASKFKASVVYPFNILRHDKEWKRIWPGAYELHTEFVHLLDRIQSLSD